MPQRYSPVYALLFLLALLCILASIQRVGWNITWSTLQVPFIYPPFADMRTVQGALSSLAQGHNPQLLNPGDLWGRPMNYPMVWVHIADFFSFQEERRFLGFIAVTILGYVAACYLMLRKYPSVWMLAAMLSGASLLAMERGNNDLVVFTLCFLAAALPYAWVAAGIILAATALKLYPAFCGLLFYRQPRILLATLAGLALVLVLNFDALTSIRASTPANNALSYGSPSLAMMLKRSYHLELPVSAINILLVMLSLGWLMCPPLRKLLETHPIQATERRLFITGATLYVATFMLSSNWDYRLIMLILCMPLCLYLKHRATRLLTMALIVISCNQIWVMGLIGKPGELVNVVSKTVLFSLLLALLFSQLQAGWRNRGSLFVPMNEQQ